jgi:hypothetical protein
MNWKQRIFKPKWQNKNADIRLEAVSSEHDPRLIANLVEIAASDPDQRVRIAAVKRLHQLENILRLHAGEKDAEVKSILEERVRQLAAATNETRPPLQLRLQVVEMTGNRELIEHLARHAPEVELRKAALAKVTRQGVLGDCCIEDEDADIRRMAGDMIQQHTTLKRVIDELRKKDKALHTVLQERLHRELLEKGDPRAIEAEALRICTALEKLALAVDSDKKEETGALFSEWQVVAGKVSQGMAQRYQRVHQRLTEPAPSIPPSDPGEMEASKIEKAPPEVSVTTVEASTTANDHLAKVTTTICQYQSENSQNPSSRKVENLRGQLEKAWRQCQAPHSTDRVNRDTANTALAAMEASIEQKKQKESADLAEAGELLNAMQSALENGELHNALEKRSTVQNIVKSHGKGKNWKAIQSRLAGMHARLRELRDWHHWSNDKIRKRLIAEMEILPSANLHPDALLDRIKSLQTEWKQLEESEQIPGEKRFSAAPWMWRKFNDAGHKAFETAKPFLDKRTEIQSRLLDKISEFCADFESVINTEPTDWIALGKKLKSARKKLGELSGLPASQRKKAASRLKAVLTRGNALMQDRYEAIEKEKMKLIRAASQLAHVADQSEAISQAKSLQSDWKAAGSLWRKKEQELWNQFREYLDPLFSELKEAQASEKAAENEKLAAQRELCAEMAGILQSEEKLADLQGKVMGLEDSWKEIEHPDRKLQQKFQSMRKEYQQKLEARETQALQANRQRWWSKADLLHELAVNGRTAKGALSKKALTAFKTAWPQESSDDEFEKQLDAAAMQLLEGPDSAATVGDPDEAISQARLLCISLEFIAGLPSPEEDKDRRMKYQVDRLAHSMAGDGERLSVNEEAAESEKNWLKMYTLPDPEFQAFRNRVQSALSTINESI